ncbi:peptidoglycan-binding domain-containing protein [Stenotrophomonas sp. SMYL89]|uniref:peptidoglycan-binding domain-containing protein n=1 Tax=Stenotrophomonas sp. SMYL89 TaxID=3076046 RepID=UPI002E7A4CFE|nr:peptidoglycan-binding protein [Stenotrophomonas sp. SMYL89]HDS1663095.1 peptidoglycan-binding protein [Stenotrophomonas maltophilia]
MPTNIDTHDLDATSGAVYFAVGRGTEGGPASYHLAIAGITQGVTEPHWGTVNKVAQNSGYSLGAIQVDFGQRGEWALGAIDGHALKAGETTYVDAVIDQASSYAKAHNLPFTQDHADLRRDLLSHGNGLSGRSSIQFIDTSTRDSINAWAGSAEGKQWIHANIDYPQVRNATRIGMTMVDAHGSGIAEENRFEAISLIAKTANQLPSQLPKLQKVLEEGGDYEALRAKAGQIRETYQYFDAPKAGDIAVRYEDAYANNKDAMDRAHAKVSSRDYSPAGEHNDADIQVALGQIGAPRQQAGSQTLKEGSSGRDVLKLESNLVTLGHASADGQQTLNPDRRFDATTRKAVEDFQRAHNLDPVDGKAGPATLAAIDRDARELQGNLAALGLTDAKGQAIGSDGYLGGGSRHAINTFQQQHGLPATGIADAETRQALANEVRQRAQGQGNTPEQQAAAEPARETVYPMSDPRSPQNWLYTETLVQVKFAEEARGLPSGEHSEKLAAALTVEAARAGLYRVDRVELNQDGSMARAVQANALHDESALNRNTAPVSTADAMRQSVQENSERALQVSDQQREQQKIDQQTQQHGPRAMMA